MVRRRDGEGAKVFIADLAGRLPNRVQLTTDGQKAYLQAVEEFFWSKRGLYAMLVKLYAEPQGKRANANIAQANAVSLVKPGVDLSAS